MRTTLTLGDALARQLKRIARQTDRSFKKVVNTTLRRGLSRDDEPGTALPPFRVEAKHCGFRTGVDVDHLNRLSDEIVQAELHSNDSDFERFPGLRWVNPLG